MRKSDRIAIIICSPTYAVKAAGRMKSIVYVEPRCCWVEVTNARIGSAGGYKACIALARLLLRKLRVIQLGAGRLRDLRDPRDLSLRSQSRSHT
jgi:hypothetical protein